VGGQLIDRCGGVSWGECCPEGLTCCGYGCYDPATQQCCYDIHGERYVCDKNKRCCSEPGGGHYCPSPCRDEITDTTSCSKDHEPSYNGCLGCQQLHPPACTTYREYTGLQIKTCYDGCPSTDWNESTEDCYIVRKCFPLIHTKSLCIECEGEFFCAQITDPPPPGGDDCRTVGQCIFQAGCDFVENCFQCEQAEGSEIITTVPSETCNCK
jgi:hypothetical protein